jgi:hypothetical protein
MKRQEVLKIMVNFLGPGQNKGEMGVPRQILPFLPTVLRTSNT